MEACAIRQPIDFTGVIKFVTANYTKSSHGIAGIAALLPNEWHTKTLLRTFDDPKVSSLREKIRAEISLYPQYLPQDLSAVLELTDELSNVIASIEYEKVVVEITPSSTIKFKFILDDDKRLMITKPLGINELSREEVVFSIFFNNDLLVSDVKNINELVQGLNRFNKGQASHSE